MTVRQSIGPKLRFEVFKRDSFTCQYCGSKAPEVVLQVDHIHPVAEGGDADIMNLVTSCRACNGGKGARLLSDASVVEKQRAQIEELEERRQQLEMMLQWRDGVRDLGEAEVQSVVDRIGRRGLLEPNDAGRADIRRWVKKYGLAEVLIAADESFDVYLRFSGGKPTPDSWEDAFRKIGGVLSVREESKTRPHLQKLLYIQGIIRRRSRNKWMRCVDALESFLADGIPLSELEFIAKQVDDWEMFCGVAESVVTSLREKSRG